MCLLYTTRAPALGGSAGFMGNSEGREWRGLLDIAREEQKGLSPLAHQPPADAWAKYAPVGTFVPVFRTPFPALEPLEGTDRARMEQLDSHLTKAIRTNMAHEAHYETVRTAERKNTTEAMATIPDELRRALWSVMDLFLDTKTGTYHPGANRFIRHRLYTWLSVQAESGRLTTARIASLMRCFHALFDANGRPRLFVSSLVDRFLPVLAWAEERYGSRVFVTPFGDAAELQERVYLPDGEPTVEMDSDTKRRIGLRLDSGAGVRPMLLAGMVESMWRARRMTLPPSQWFILMCTCERIAMQLQKEERAWSELVLARAPLPQTALLRVTRKLLPDDVLRDLPGQWFRPSSLVVTLMAHVLSLLEDCETLRAAVALSESNLAAYVPDVRRSITVLFPTLRHRTQAPSDDEWRGLWEGTRAWCAMAMDPVFLAYVSCVMVGAHDDRCHLDWAPLLRDVIEPMVLGRAVRYSVDAALQRLRVDYERCMRMDAFTRLRMRAPLCHPVAPVLAVSLPRVSRVSGQIERCDRVWVHPDTATAIANEFELQWDGRPITTGPASGLGVPIQLLPAT